MNDDVNFKNENIMSVNRLDRVYLLMRFVSDGESYNNDYEFDKVVGVYADKDTANEVKIHSPDYGGNNRYYQYSVVTRGIIY